MFKQLIVLGLVFLAFLAHAEESQSTYTDIKPLSLENEETERFSFHGQATYINQRHNDFSSPYNGGNSLLNRSEGSDGRSFTLTGTIFLGAKIGDNTEVYYNPEMFEGIPFTGSLVGLGGFQNGELQKGAYIPPVYYTARAFVKHTFQFGGEREYLDSSANQLAGYFDTNRLVISVGKFNTLDFFDDNSYSHDPRVEFQNFSLFSMGAYNYAADTKGFTFGIVAEWFKDDWLFKAARLAMPKVPNTADLDYSLQENYGDQVEVSHQHILLGQPGVARLLVFKANAFMSTYQDAIDLGIKTNTTPDIVSTRYGAQSVWGYGVNIEQALTKDIGLFARWSWNTGDTETQTLDISQSLSGGFSIKGGSWGRPDDTVGIGYAINGISASEIDYLNRGGLTAFIGDGKLQYDREKIFEAFYSIKAHKYLYLTADFQRIENPAFNSARGPINIFGLRAHAEF
jgi:high affinity Mn2+ porin